MDQKKKQIIFLLGSIFVAVIFLSSYAAFSSNGGSSTVTSTLKSQVTVPTFGNSNAVIVNYSTTNANVTIYNHFNSSKTNITKIFSQLQANGSIQSYSSTSNNVYQIVLSTLSPYQLQQIIYNKTGLSNSSINVSSVTYVKLPSNVTLYTSTNIPVVVFPPKTNYSVYLKNVKKIGARINVSISALLTRNGSIYNNMFRVSYSH